jgi:hypothetical protein
MTICNSRHQDNTFSTKLEQNLFDAAGESLGVKSLCDWYRVTNKQTREVGLQPFIKR